MGLYSTHIYPRLIEWSLGDEAHGEERRRALALAQGKVLEIGFGTGLNLRHYPNRVGRVTVIDTKRMLPKIVEQRIAEAGVAIDRSELDPQGRLPFEDSTFDTIVTTWTLCSIADVNSALAEIRRVVKPAGKYLFLEHGRSDDPKVARLQNLFNPITKLLGCGCNMNRPIDRLIREAGLNIVSLDRFIMPGTPRVGAEMYRGFALRA